MSVVAFDTETGRIEPGLYAPPLVCVSIAAPFSPPLLFDRADGLKVLRGYLTEPDRILVGHSVAYDFACACAVDPELVPLVFAAYSAGRVRDTKIRGQLLDIAAGCLNYPRPDKSQGYSLAALLVHAGGRSRFAEKTGDDVWRLRFAELLGVPLALWPKEARDYAQDDAADTLFVWGSQGSEQLVDEVRQVRAAWALHLASVWGMRTDGVRLAELEIRVKAEFRKVQDKMLAEGLFRFERHTKKERDAGKEAIGFDEKGKPLKLVRNSKVVAARVVEAYAALGVEVPLTEKDRIATDADTLARTADPLLMELGESGPLKTILTTFLPTLKRGVSVPINTDFRALVETGRISSANPNLNNIPREGGVRECFVPRPGYYYLACDYNAAELRSLAQVCLRLFGRSALAEFFQSDPAGDPHLELAAVMLKIPVAEAKARKKAGDPIVLDARQGAKAYNFGFPGGLGVDTMIVLARVNYGVTLTYNEAMAGKVAWFTRWPEMRLYLAWINRLVGAGTAVVTQFHPRDEPHRQRGNVGYCDGANGFFQGLTADGAKEALWRVSRECHTDPKSALWGTHPVGFLYDELLCETPIAGAHDAAMRLSQVMVEAMREWLPDVPVLAEPVLMDRWSKNAKQARDEQGRLTVWRAAA